MRQPLVAATRRNDRKAAGARPVHQVADQGRLVTEGQRIHHTRVSRLAGQQRSTKSVGLDRHVDHVFTMGKGFEAVVHRGDRMAGAFHDHIDRRMLHQRSPVVADKRGTRFKRPVQRFGARPLRIPAHACQVGTRRIRRQVGDTDQMHAWRAWNLRQVHGAEFSGTNQADTHRPAIGRALLEFCVKAHQETSMPRSAEFAIGSGPVVLMPLPSFLPKAPKRFARHWLACHPSREDSPDSP